MAALSSAERLPGPVPDGDTGYVWPTWREALVDAQAGIASAKERRQSVFQAAFDAGLTLAQIDAAVGLTAPGVHKIIGKQKGATTLDAPAFQERA
jgi:hypothetical protein